MENPEVFFIFLWNTSRRVKSNREYPDVFVFLSIANHRCHRPDWLFEVSSQLNFVLFVDFFHLLTSWCCSRVKIVLTLSYIHCSCKIVVRIVWWYTWPLRVTVNSSFIVRVFVDVLLNDFSLGRSPKFSFRFLHLKMICGHD